MVDSATMNPPHMRASTMSSLQTMESAVTAMLMILRAFPKSFRLSHSASEADRHAHNRPDGEHNGGAAEPAFCNIEGIGNFRCQVIELLLDRHIKCHLGGGCYSGLSATWVGLSGPVEAPVDGVLQRGGGPRDGLEIGR